MPARPRPGRGAGWVDGRKDSEGGLDPARPFSAGPGARAETIAILTAALGSRCAGRLLWGQARLGDSQPGLSAEESVRTVTVAVTVTQAVRTGSLSR